MLALLLLNRLPALPPDTDAELDPLDELPKTGDEGATEAGVAMSVGVMSLRVIMATVVSVLDRLLVFGLLRVGLKRFGRITGVKVRLGFVKVDDDLDAEFLDDPLNELCEANDDEDSDGFRVVDNTNSVSKSSILIMELDANVGVLEARASS